MSMYRRTQKTLFVAALLSTLLGACGKEDHRLQSRPLITDVEHTRVKRQSIGNCWLYAQASWLESLHRSATGKSFDVSESYWTYWHWYDQIVGAARWGRKTSKVNTGGNWKTSVNLMKRYGIMSERDFIPSEARSDISWTQQRAESFVNQELDSGSLSNRFSRTSENVMAVLDRAFKVHMDEKRPLAISMEQFEVATGRDLDRVDVLSNVIDDWQQYSLSGFSTRSVLKFVKQALNDRLPVVMSTWVDFRYLNTDTATFQGEIYDESQEGDGGHMVVLEDYVVDHPELGFIGEGNMSDDIKEKALEGELVYVKAKNSWGTRRPERGLTDGYTRFTMDWLLESSRKEVGYQYTSFILPRGLYR